MQSTATCVTHLAVQLFTPFLSLGGTVLEQGFRCHHSSSHSLHICLQVIAQLELWNEKKTGRYENKVYVLPKHLDEKVAALHLPKLGARLTKLTPDQSAYINVPEGGPFKPAHYRY